MKENRGGDVTLCNTMEIKVHLALPLLVDTIHRGWTWKLFRKERKEWCIVWNNAVKTETKAQSF